MTSRQEMKMANYFQAPNEMIDSIVGSVISGNAAWVVMTVWRYTEGMTDKRTGQKRKSAPIPTKTFMRVLNTDRTKTAYKYIKEAVESGLICVEKQKGKVSLYSINRECEHWFSGNKLVAKSATTQPVAENASSGEKCHIVVAENATATSGEKRHTYKERDTKEICTKEILSNTHEEKPKTKKSKTKKPSTPEKPEQVSDQVWSDLLTLRKTKKAPLTVTAWNQAYKQILIARQKTNHSIEQIISEWISAAWVGFKSDWYINRVGARPNIDPSTDRLAVNNQWRQGESNIVEANTDINDMLGGV